MTWTVLAAATRDRRGRAVLRAFARRRRLHRISDAAVLGIYAELDDFVNPTMEAVAAALESAGLEHELITFEGVDHAFFNDTGRNYNEAAAAEAYTAMLDWFATHLAASQPGSRQPSRLRNNSLRVTVRADGRPDRTAKKVTVTSVLPPPPPPPQPPRPTEVPAGRRPAAAVVALFAVVALGAAAIGGWWVGREDADSGPTIVIPSVPATTVNQLQASGSGSATPGQASASAIDVAAIAETVAPSVVTVSATVGNGQAAGEAVGTGVIISADGEILTNAHVVAGAQDVRVRLAGNTEPIPATIVAADAGNDPALLRVDIGADLPAVTVADPATVRIGDPVVPSLRSRPRRRPKRDTGDRVCARSHVGDQRHGEPRWADPDRRGDLVGNSGRPARQRRRATRRHQHRGCGE